MEGNGFAKLVYGTLEGNGIDTNDMPFDDAVKKFNELGGENNWKAKIMKKEAEETPSKVQFNLPDNPASQRAKQMIIDLDSEYDNERKMVKKVSALESNKSITQDGIITLASTDKGTIAHEFAHTLSSVLNGWGFVNLQKELTSLYEEYMKAVKTDRLNSISSYADNGGKERGRKIDEFMAEAFSMAYNYEKGNRTNYVINEKNLKWAQKVKALIDKYHKRENDIKKVMIK